MKNKKEGGNKYRVFSKADKLKEGEVTVGTKTFSATKCSHCDDGCVSNYSGEKHNLCYNCYFGRNNHKKLGKPKNDLTTNNNGDTV